MLCKMEQHKDKYFPYLFRIQKSKTFKSLILLASPRGITSNSGTVVIAIASSGRFAKRAPRRHLGRELAA